MGGEEAEVGAETAAGEATNVSSSTGTTETGTGVTAVGISQDPRDPTRATTLTTRDHTMIATEPTTASPLSICSLQSYHMWQSATVRFLCGSVSWTTAERCQC